MDIESHGTTETEHNEAILSFIVTFPCRVLIYLPRRTINSTFLGLKCKSARVGNEGPEVTGDWSPKGEELGSSCCCCSSVDPSNEHDLLIPQRIRRIRREHEEGEMNRSVLSLR